MGAVPQTTYDSCCPAYAEVTAGAARCFGDGCIHYGYVCERRTMDGAMDAQGAVEAKAATEDVDDGACPGQ
jgi:hypothetical protein